MKRPVIITGSMAVCRKEWTLEKIAGQIYERVKGLAAQASFDEIYSLYLYRLSRYGVRIAENGLPEKKEKKKRGCGQAESEAERHEQKGMPELRKEDETAVYRIAAL